MEEKRMHLQTNRFASWVVEKNDASIGGVKLCTELDRFEAEGVHERIGVVEAEDLAKGQGKASIDKTIIEPYAAEEGGVHKHSRCKPLAMDMDLHSTALLP
jgi:hypothetical protein